MPDADAGRRHARWKAMPTDGSRIHPRTPCLDPTWISIYEMSGPETLGDPKVKEANSTGWAQRMHAVTTEARLGILERITPP